MGRECAASDPPVPGRRRWTAVTGHRHVGGDVSLPAPNTAVGPAPIPLTTHHPFTSLQRKGLAPRPEAERAGG